MVQSCIDEPNLDQPPLPASRADLEAREGFQDDETLFIYATEEEEQADSLTVLGRLRNNPFTVENMSEAYRTLWDPNAPNLDATHRYIEFSPSTWRELGDVSDKFDVFDFDVRYEVIHIGQYYPQPGTETDDTEIPKRWAVIDASDPLPTEFNHTVIADLFITDPRERTLTKQAFDQVGEPYGTEGENPDGAPVPGCLTCCQNYPNCNLVCDPDPNFYGCTECCESYPQCLRQPSLVCTGPPDPPEPNLLPCGCSQPNNFRTVAGCVQVEDSDHLSAVSITPPPGSGTVAQINVVPVRNLRVKVYGDFFWVSTVQTNDQGCFRTPHNFSSLFNVRIWLKWKNDHMHMNGWTPGTGSAYRIGVDRFIGVFEVSPGSNLNRMHIVMPNVGDRQSRAQVWYQASHMLNGVMRARDLSIEEGIPAPPDNLRVVISNNNSGAGAAPMFRASGTSVAIVAGTCVAANALFGPGAGLPVCAVSIAASRLIPDVWQNYGNENPARSGSRTTNVFMHELGHAVHWRDVPNADWNANVNRTIVIFSGGLIQPNNPIFEDPYGNGTVIPGFGWTATIEAWAEHYGAKSHGIEYGDVFYQGTGLGAGLRGLEGFIPSATGIPGERWIPEGIAQDLEDDADPAWEGMRFSPLIPMNDNVGGLSMAAFHAALISAGQRPTPTDVRNRIITMFLPAGQTAADYNAAYATYGW